MSIEVPESPLAASMVGLLTGGWVAQAVSVAARLKIADQLAHGPRSAADIAEAVDAHAPTLHRLLRALSDVGVVQEREDGLFSGTPLGELLRSDVPSLRGYALLTGAPFHAGPPGTPWSTASAPANRPSRTSTARRSSTTCATTPPTATS